LAGSNCDISSAQDLGWRGNPEASRVLNGGTESKLICDEGRAINRRCVTSAKRVTSTVVCNQADEYFISFHFMSIPESSQHQARLHHTIEHDLSIDIANFGSLFGIHRFG